jgi:hypothetical protein
MKSFATILIVIVVVLAGIFLYLWGTSAPAVSLSPDSGPVSASRELSVKLQAPRGSLKKLTVTVVQGDKKVDVLAKNFGSGTREVRQTFNLSRAGLKDGPFTLQVAAGGTSIFSFGGRTSEKTQSFTLDNTPPVVAILSTAHNIIRGGAGLVVYTVSKEVEKTGVVFGDRFCPGYRQGGNFYACLFPFPYNVEPDRYIPRVMAVDRAGNERLAGINYHLIVKPFSTDRINLTDSFLEKISPEFKNKFPQAKTPLEIFLKANSELRAQNIKTIFELARQTSPVPLWKGEFLRMPRTAPLGGFAQARTYLYNGAQVDQQTHLGFDLASSDPRPVPAANNGKVIFAGDLGIYGQCIIIDHGIGLQTLYGHLSRIGVKVGDSIEKGQVIGNTGSTGMVFGDHLHFGVVVGGQEVSPVEWWDPSWLKNNITGKLVLGKDVAPR